MKKFFFCCLGLVIIIGFPLILQSCLPGKSTESGITVSIEPVKYFTDRLTSKKVDVNIMVPMGANPATYSPTSNQLVKLSSSGLYVQVGHLGFEEAWMNRLTELNPEMNVLNLSEGLQLQKGDDHVHGDHVHRGGTDPHIWMSPKLVKRFLPKLKAALVESFPEHKDIIEKNYPTLLEEIEELDASFENLVADLEYRKFMIFHPALTYLARDYGLKQISIEYEGKEPSPTRLRSLIDEANEENIRIIFIQAEFDQRNAEMVREATGATLAVINPLSYNWTETMKEIRKLLGEHLE